MKNELSLIIKGCLNNLGYDVSCVHISKSDLCDFQCNDLFKIAKEYHKSPIEIGEALVNEINGLDDFSLYFDSISFAKPGFINIMVSDLFINKYITDLNDNFDSLFKSSVSETFVLDYGGPNVAKPLHVGHMRTAIVGESIKRIIEFCGHKTISDVHLGDFGLQIGEVIYGVLRDGISIDDIDIKYLDMIYPEMNAICKEDESIKNECARITKDLQDGNLEYRKLWKKILEVSCADIKRNYDFLDVSFDYWYGESDAYKYLDQVEGILRDKGILSVSDGALVVDVSESSDKKEIPPLLFKKSNGAYLYASTDLATILQRKIDFNPDHILYVVDNRQELHFIQEFRTASKAEIFSSDKLEFLGYGTVNGSDNRPYKTRSGGSPKLDSLFDDARNIFISKKDSNKDMSTDDVNKIVNAILKFADLSNSRCKDYIFDLNKFSDVTGKTGPYILYTYLRIKKILDMYGSGVLSSSSDSFDRDLRLKLLDVVDSVDLAFSERMPHYIADYVYNLCVYANVFYQNNHVSSMEDLKVRDSWIYVLGLTNYVIERMLYLLVIDIPSIM